MSVRKKNEALFRPSTWSRDTVGVNSKGDVVIQLQKGQVSLPEIADRLGKLGFKLPAVVRFPELIVKQAETLNSCFANAIKKFEYDNQYTGIYPLKVNPMACVTQTFIEETNFGLEAGSKAELLEALSLALPNNRPVLVNGHKDNGMLQSILECVKCGFRVVPILEKFSEFERLIAVSKKLKVRPRFGVRVKLRSRGSGRWQESAGDKAKFGLNTYDLLRLVVRCEEEGLTDCFELLHFHIGSQVTDVRKISKAIREATRFYARLKKRGVPLTSMDVGGGLGVDYDGTHSYSDSSMNYTVQEYANNVVAIIKEVCTDEGVEVPEILSESGRYLVAYHAMLLVESLGRTSVTQMKVPKAQKKEHDLITSLRECLSHINQRNARECVHDARDFKEDAMQLFDLGYLELEERSAVESLTWAVLKKAVGYLKGPERLRAEEELADQLIMNFSIFQSLPDYWAMEHNFPIMPIGHLNKACDQHATLADITCDSDGKISTFISGDDEIKNTMMVHKEGKTDDRFAIFLIGAYQDILGDLHNLFGPLNEVEVTWHKKNKKPHVHALDEGSNVNDTLSLMHLDAEQLVSNLLKTLTSKCDSQAQKNRIKKHFKKALEDNTYFNASDVIGS